MRLICSLRLCGKAISLGGEVGWKTMANLDDYTPRLLVRQTTCLDGIVANGELCEFFVCWFCAYIAYLLKSRTRLVGYKLRAIAIHDYRSRPCDNILGANWPRYLVVLNKCFGFRCESIILLLLHFRMWLRRFLEVRTFYLPHIHCFNLLC